jgi:hypothetical protein
MFNIYFAMYIVACLALVGGVTQQFMKMNMSIGGGIFGIGSVLICILFGIKWFYADNALLAQTPVPWPTVVNTCPDFLTLYMRDMPGGIKEKNCIDRVGVSRNLTGTISKLKIFPSDGHLTIPTDESVFFPLKTNTSDPQTELCDRAMRYGLTWEGVTNGESCFVRDSKTGSGSGPGSDCPTTAT